MFKVSLFFTTSLHLLHFCSTLYLDLHLSNKSLGQQLLSDFFINVGCVYPFSTIFSLPTPSILRFTCTPVLFKLTIKASH